MIGNLLTYISAIAVAGLAFSVIENLLARRIRVAVRVSDRASERSSDAELS